MCLAVQLESIRVSGLFTSSRKAPLEVPGDSGSFSSLSLLTQPAAV